MAGMLGIHHTRCQQQKCELRNLTSAFGNQTQQYNNIPFEFNQELHLR